MTLRSCKLIYKYQELDHRNNIFYLITTNPTLPKKLETKQLRPYFSRLTFNKQTSSCNCKNARSSQSVSSGGLNPGAYELPRVFMFLPRLEFLLLATIETASALGRFKVSLSFGERRLAVKPLIFFKVSTSLPCRVT